MALEFSDTISSAAIPKAADVAALTDNSGGTSGNGTIASVTTIAQAANAIATLAQATNQILTSLKNAGFMS